MGLIWEEQGDRTVWSLLAGDYLKCLTWNVDVGNPKHVGCIEGPYSDIIYFPLDSIRHQEEVVSVDSLKRNVSVYVDGDGIDPFLDGGRTFGPQQIRIGTGGCFDYQCSSGTDVTISVPFRDDFLVHVPCLDGSRCDESLSIKCTQVCGSHGSPLKVTFFGNKLSGSKTARVTLMPRQAEITVDLGRGAYNAGCDVSISPEPRPAVGCLEDCVDCNGGDESGDGSGGDTCTDPQIRPGYRTNDPVTISATASGCYKFKRWKAHVSFYDCEFGFIPQLDDPNGVDGSTSPTVSFSSNSGGYKDGCVFSYAIRYVAEFERYTITTGTNPGNIEGVSFEQYWGDADGRPIWWSGAGACDMLIIMYVSKQTECKWKFDNRWSIPDSDYNTLAGWVGESYTAYVIEIKNVARDRTVRARFTEVWHYVTVSGIDYSLTPSGTNGYRYGDVVQLVLKAQQCYRISSVQFEGDWTHSAVDSYDDYPDSKPHIYRLEVGCGNLEVTASQSLTSRIRYNVHVDNESHGCIYAFPQGCLPRFTGNMSCEGSLTYKAVPYPCFSFDHWMIGDERRDTAEVTIQPDSGDIWAVAYFKRSQSGDDLAYACSSGELLRCRGSGGSLLYGKCHCADANQAGQDTSSRSGDSPSSVASIPAKKESARPRTIAVGASHPDDEELVYAPKPHASTRSVVVREKEYVRPSPAASEEFSFSLSLTPPSRV